MRQEPVALPYFSRTGLRQAFSTRHGPLLPVSPGPEPARAPPPSLRLQPDLILHSEAAVAPLPPSPPPPVRGPPHRQPSRLPPPSTQRPSSTTNERAARPSPQTLLFFPFLDSSVSSRHRNPTLAVFTYSPKPPLHAVPIPSLLFLLQLALRWPSKATTPSQLLVAASVMTSRSGNTEDICYSIQTSWQPSLGPPAPAPSQSALRGPRGCTPRSPRAHSFPTCSTQPLSLADLRDWPRVQPCTLSLHPLTRFHGIMSPECQTCPH